MKRYRKLPVVIEAVRWTGENIREIEEFLGHGVDLDRVERFWIGTREGDIRASIGDWIIRGVKGEFYPCKPDVFDATYVEAEEQELTLDAIADSQFAWLKEVGWLQTNALEDLALISSEVGEAVNECRGEKLGENFATELADIVLRVLGLGRKQNVDVSSALVAKMKLNKQRGNRGRIR